MTIESLQTLCFVLLTSDPRAKRLGDHLAVVGTTVARATSNEDAIAAIGAGKETVLVVDQARWFTLSPDHLAVLVEARRSGLLRIILLAKDPATPSAHASFDAVVSPRTSANDVVTTVARVALDFAGAVPSGAPISAQRPALRTRVLVADDSELLLRITYAILTRAGYEVTCTVNPFDTYTCLRNVVPDVSLIDYNMPGIRGDQMIEMMRREGLRTPMLLYSSAPEAVLQDAARRSGAVGYIVKGCSPEALLERIQQVLREHAPQGIAQRR